MRPQAVIGASSGRPVDLELAPRNQEGKVEFAADGTGAIIEVTNTSAGRAAVVGHANHD